MNDLIIIGAGPGGYELALEASKNNLSVTLIEENKVGGVCLHAGCIPTKTYYKNAKFIKELKIAEKFGVEINNYDFDFLKVYNRKNKVVSTLQQGISFLLNKARVNVVLGSARIVNKNTVVVNGNKYFGKYIVIATGSKPIKLDGFDSALYSDDILKIKDIPQTLSIIGGGIIGVEIASIFHQFGSKVQIFEMADRLIPQADVEISKRIASILRKEGIEVYLQAKAKKYENRSLEVIINNDKKVYTTEKVLVAIGRKPNFQNIGLDKINIEYNQKGIIVNEHFQTNIDNIYAIGDVCGKVMLAHYATYCGRYVLKHILHQKSKINFQLVPNVVFTFPEISWVGLTENDCHDFGEKYEVYKGLYRANGKALADNATDGFVKIIVVNDVIKGVHIIGEDASTLIHEMSALMNVNISKKDFLDIIHAHPTLNEIFNNALNNSL